MYIDLDKAKKEFDNYTSNYDTVNDDDLKRKYQHTYKVMNNALMIAESLNLNEEQTQLAMLIGLLHDLARFDQKKLYGTFNDKKSFDHGDYAVELLKKDNYIRKFVESDKYDEIIYKAVGNHNKFEIENIDDEETLLQCKIIRDADKIDIFDNAIFWYWRSDKEIKELEESTISDFAYNAFKERRPVYRPEEYTKLDEMLTLFGFVFDFYYDISKKTILEKNYFEDILKRFNFTNQEVADKIKEITEIAIDELKS